MGNMAVFLTVQSLIIHESEISFHTLDQALQFECTFMKGPSSSGHVYDKKILVNVFHPFQNQEKTKL